MPSDPASLYLRLRQLVESMPSFENEALSADDNLWLGRAHQLVTDANVQNGIDAIVVNVATNGMASPLSRPRCVQEIRGAVYRALAYAEQSAPIQVQGSFIAVGHAFDAISAVDKIFSRATSTIRVIDAYMDANALTEFGALAPAGVRLELLADAASVKPGLKPACAAWFAQFTGTRPVEAKVARARELHDRLIMIDGSEVWSVSQSLNALAKRSPASISRLDPDLSALKIAHYDALWGTALPL